MLIGRLCSEPTHDLSNLPVRHSLERALEENDVGLIGDQKRLKLQDWISRQNLTMTPGRKNSLPPNAQGSTRHHSTSVARTKTEFYTMDSKHVKNILSTPARPFPPSQELNSGHIMELDLKQTRH